MVNLYNVFDDAKQRVFPDGNVMIYIQQRNAERWIVYVKLLYGHETAKLEFIVEDSDDPDVAASVIRYGSVSRHRITMFMDRVLERLGQDDQTSSSE